MVMGSFFSVCSLFRKMSDTYEKLRVSGCSLTVQLPISVHGGKMWLMHGVCHLQKLEGRVASDEDLKLSDLLRYYDRDSQAALVRVALD